MTHVDTTAPEHYDDYCVNQFAKMMREKMALSRAKGRSGWQDPAQCSTDYLRDLLYIQIHKGDPVDVAIICMMLRHYEASTAPVPPASESLTVTLKPDLTDVRAMLSKAEADWQHLNTIAAMIHINTLRHGGTHEQSQAFVKGEADFISWLSDQLHSAPAASNTPALFDPEGHWGDFIKSAVPEADKAMRKYPQPNYVISKVAEEAGEVVKAAIHCAEGRETAENVRAEMRQLIAMLYRLWIEGDQVHGLPPVSGALTHPAAGLT